MDRVKREKLLKYLFPNEKIKRFLINEVYLKLNEVIDKSLCFSTNNLKVETRKENLKQVSYFVEMFFNENKDIYSTLVKLYEYNDFTRIINDVVVGYVFYICSTFKKYENINIFKDKRSICYAVVSLIDIL